ncbi:Tenascin-R [Symbiodinium microadriaticum]|uniref:Tenascin-R n=1 Tax=Symbiodinium microadriaticum TaxID=2951 RepID=A0A1Q9CSR5_SYMMI|nr:Tenascin-R [Symbiodinium microadriaticum]
MADESFEIESEVRSKYGAEGLKSFSDKCRDIEFANQQIEYMAARSVGLSMFARAPLIDFAQWEQQFGVLVETRQATQTRPFEETEWILRQVNKYGREKEEAASDWKQKLAGPWKRDYAGHGGKIRLWLPSKEYEEKGSSQFIQGASKEVSKSKKNPKEFELEAFRLHAVEAGFNHGHSFFGGVPMSTDDDDEQADGEPSSQAQQPVPQKRKAVADTLDASEDEADAGSANKKKPRKASNLPAARASFFESVSKQFLPKVASITSKVDEAKKVQEEEHASPKPESATDITTRKLYLDALAAAVKVATAWLDAAKLSAAVQEHNEACKDDVEKQVSVEKEESLSTQSSAWQWLLSNAGSAVRLERADFLRGREMMEKFVNNIPSCELDETKLDKQRLIWRRMFASLSQLDSSLKKCTGDVSKHVKALASSREREAKKLKDKEAKDAAAKHLSTVQERISKAKADGADMPGIFKMQVDDLAKVKTCKQDALTSDMDVTQPLVLEKGKHVGTWANTATCLQVLTNFGGRYKKVPNIEELGKVNQPFQAKAGKEPTELFFNELLKSVKPYLVDLSEVASAWTTTSWMFGLLPKRIFIQATPNCAAMLRTLQYGEVEIYLFPILHFVSALKTAGMTVPSSFSELEKAVEDLSSETWKQLSKDIGLTYHTLSKEQVLYVPTGYMTVERSSSSPMIYGARKSFFLVDAKSAVVSLYALCVELSSKDGKNVDKMNEVLGCLKSETYNGSACDERVCPVCQNNGTNLTAEWTCDCPITHQGERCEYLRCPGDCNNAGDCDKFTGVCACFDGYDAGLQIASSSRVFMRLVPITNAIELSLTWGLLGYDVDNKSAPDYDYNFDLFDPEVQVLGP